MEWSEQAAVCVIAASAGYPGAFARDLTISGLEHLTEAEALVFHAGTKRAADGSLLTNGGRVLGVTALGTDIAEARTRAYGALEKVQFAGKHARTDIAQKALV